MERITELDAVQLSQVNNPCRSEILYQYLVEGKPQDAVAQKVFPDFGDDALARVSVVIRGFGFHNRRCQGGYPSLPQSLIRDFVRDCVPEDFDGGLDEGAFDLYISDYLQQVMTMQQDAERRKRVLSIGTGGMSGPAVKPVALRMVYEVAHAVKVPVIGLGGISCATDAIEFLLAGASAVQIGTHNFVDPAITVKVAQGINEYLDRHGFASVADIVGTVE